jgi:ABC-type phosphate/phosphonate transport system substrate-binding protein
VTDLRGIVELVATPAYVWPGCAGEVGRSVMVVRADDPADSVRACRGRRFAMNGRDSNSGMNLPRALIAPLAEGKPFFSQVLITGAHLSSLAAVVAGEADLAAIDCVTYGLASHHRPDLVAGSRIIAQTPPTPALPFVMSRSLAPALRDVLRRALVEAIADPALGAATSRLGLAGVAFLADQDYDVVLDFERVAEARGYPELI